jgi:hypothetical protein
MLLPAGPAFDTDRQLRDMYVVPRQHSSPATGAQVEGPMSGLGSGKTLVFS